MVLQPSKLLKFFFLVVIVNILIISQLEAQEIPSFENLLEDISTNADEEADISSILDDISPFYQNPINLNVASREQLEKLQFLSDVQIQNLIDYRLKYGNLLTIYELKFIDLYDDATILNLIPFVKVEQVQNDSISIQNILQRHRSELILRTQWVVEKQQGYSNISDSLLQKSPNSRYTGNNKKLYAKYKFQTSKHLKFGFVAEKDAGEQFFGVNEKTGFDYYSAYIQLNNVNKFKTLIVGDYDVEFGQGLVCAGGLSLIKSSNVLMIKKQAKGIKSYSSTDENRFFRGIAATIPYKNIDISLFYSYHRVDANAEVTDTLIDDEYITALSTTGLHSIPSEIDNKDAVKQHVAGGNITAKFDFFKIGATVISSKYNKDFEQNTSPYQLYNTDKQHNTNFSFDYQAFLHGVSIFGEIAMQPNGNKALMSGFAYSLSSRMAISVLARNYEKEFKTVFGKSFSENTLPENEKGIFFGAQITPFKYAKINAYIDRYVFPWLKFQTNSPSAGYDYLLEFDYRVNRKLNFYIRYKNKLKVENTSDVNTAVKFTVPVEKQSFRFNLKYNISSQINIQNRIEYVIYKKDAEPQETGLLMFQDVNYDFQKVPLQCHFRFAIFDTDSYKSAIWAYENDILYAFCVPVFYSKGIRTSATFCYSFSKNVDFWFKFGQTYYSDKQYIGDGLSRIDGKTKSEVKMEIIVKF